MHECGTFVIRSVDFNSIRPNSIQQDGWNVGNFCWSIIDHLNRLCLNWNWSPRVPDLCDFPWNYPTPQMKCRKSNELHSISCQTISSSSFFQKYNSIKEILKCNFMNDMTKHKKRNERLKITFFFRQDTWIYSS